MTYKVEYDNALNEAGWVMTSQLHRYGPVNGAQFNAMKSCLKEAIEAYLTQKVKDSAR